MTLAILACRTLGERATMLHAIAPAVPAEATRRVEAVARGEGWALHLLDGGEFGDGAYLASPYDRCFHRKTRLYAALAGVGGGVMLSGTNTDDLADYRPDLGAASDHSVRHPFVEAGVDTRGARALYRQLGYAEIAELPAAPCLPSRIEAAALTSVHPCRA